MQAVLRTDSEKPSSEALRVLQSYEFASRLHPSVLRALYAASPRECEALSAFYDLSLEMDDCVDTKEWASRATKLKRKKQQKTVCRFWFATAR